MFSPLHLKSDGFETRPYGVCTTSILQSFRSLDKFSRWSIITDAPFDERLSHHEDREGYEERITERTSNLKQNVSYFVLFVCFVVQSFFWVAAPQR